MQRDLVGKDVLISDVNKRLDLCQKHNVDLILNQGKLEAMVGAAERKAWSLGRWLDDKILDSYFDTFGQSLFNLQSKTMFFGPSLTQLLRFGDACVVADQLKQLSFFNSCFSFFCVGNNVNVERSDTNLH